MTGQSTEKKIEFQPSWKNHILGYTISILLIPLLGIGFFCLYFVYRRHKKYSYTFTDTQISSRDEKYQRNIDLLNFEQVEVEQSWLQRKMDVGNLVLYTTATSMTLRGMQNPGNLKEVLQKAIAAEKKRHQKKEKTKPKQPDHKPGSMDKMEYLTGLWQQGLVSDEDFEKEKKHFE